MPVPTPNRLSVDELCAKYSHEAAHASHVTRLALILFDATRALVGAPAEDRPLLEAACRLHDIGYGAKPRRHAEAGRAFVLQEGLGGFSDAQRADIAAAIVLHSSQVTAEETRALAARLPDPRRALRLAAWLRIADGLDHCHLQDAAIVSVRAEKRAIRVGVCCPHSPLNRESARRKSDLWNTVFPMRIRLVRAAGPTGPLVGPELPPGEAARRLLFLYFRVLQANVGGAVAAKETEPLHIVRVAIRRLRAVLRVFRKPLARTSANRIDRELQQLNLALGEARDLDVWIDFLTSDALKRRLGHHPRWAKFVGHQRELRQLQQATVRRHLRGASFAALQVRIGRLLRIEIPRALPAMPRIPLDTFGRRMLVKNLRRALKLAELRRADSPGKLHQLRIALRRVRHVGSYFSDVLGPPGAVVVRRVHAVERTLGRMRDLDLAFARIQREGPSPPRLLVKMLERRRESAVRELARTWRRLEKPRLLRDLRRKPGA